MPWIKVCQCSKCGKMSNGGGVVGWWAVFVYDRRVTIALLTDLEEQGTDPLEGDLKHSCGLECAMSLTQRELRRLTVPANDPSETLIEDVPSGG